VWGGGWLGAKLKQENVKITTTELTCTFGKWSACMKKGNISVGIAEKPAIVCMTNHLPHDVSSPERKIKFLGEYPSISCLLSLPG
jgi:hypothetical protein